MAGFFDFIMDFLYALAALAISILPASPLQAGEYANALVAFYDIMTYINYFVPVGVMLNIMLAYVAAAFIWYAARWILRFAKYID